jgi:outer membrane protein OmpA-like peptidoglycan-associated protein
MKFFVVLLIFVTHCSIAQEDYFSGENIADANGAVEILNAGSYQIDFTGGPGLFKDFKPYPELENAKEKNSLFFKYTAPYDCRMTFNAFTENQKVQFFIFSNQTENMLSDFAEGKAVLRRSVNNPTDNSIGLDYVNDANNLIPLDIKQDETIFIVFNALSKNQSKLQLTFNFEPIESDENSNSFKKVIDLRASDTASSILKIAIRDSETGYPVIADLNLKNKKSSRLFSGSDFMFDIEKKDRINLKCDASGYFFSDQNSIISGDSSQTIVVKLRPISKGKALKIDQLEFARGTAELLPDASTALIRIKEFLLLNADVKIEIQGHVNDEGKQKPRSESLSKKRARKVKQFLVKSGVHKKRLTVKGYGNKIPIYPNPKNQLEEQANRRVEIKIL